mgnify:CR=1 FL=1
MRTGLIAKKLGMSRVFTEKGVNIPVTLLELSTCQVVSVKTEEQDGYNAVQIGAFARKAKNISKPVRGHYAKNKVASNTLIVIRIVIVLFECITVVFSYAIIRANPQVAF